LPRDFDWSVVTRLNERLPRRHQVGSRHFFDGSATIVYLKPDRLVALGRFLGGNFVSEIEPLPVSAMASSSLMGIFPESQLVGMIVREAPYAIRAQDLFAYKRGRDQNRAKALTDLAELDGEDL